jgi:hypothetical protein
LSGPRVGRGRCLFRASTTGDLYAVVDTSVYYIDQDFNYNLLGTLLSSAPTPCYMADNGATIVLVDGSPNGYQIQLVAPRTMGNIGDPNFVGSDMCDVVDSFVIFNNAGTGNWGATLSSQIVFNALDFGSLTAYPGIIQSIICLGREVWIFSALKGEVWYNAGLQGFPFQQAPSVILEHGTSAKYSLAKNDTNLYLLSQSPQGDRMVMTNEGRAMRRISNHAIEAEWKTYATISDAIGGCFQSEGHNFYVLHFPTAGKTWVYDQSLGDSNISWHEENYLDVNGVLRRMRDCFYAQAYGKNLSLDWSTGTLYEITSQVYTDQITASTTSPIAWLRRMPHMLSDKFERQTVDWLVADVEVGNDPGVGPVSLPSGKGFSSGFSSGFGGGGSTIVGIDPLISLRTSYNRGGSYGNAITQHLGKVGEYDAMPTWWNIGMARDFVFELSGASNQKFSLLGVFLDHTLHET